MVKLRFTAVVLLLASACATVRETREFDAGTSYIYTAKECERLRNTHRGWGWLSLTTATLASGSGIATASPEDEKARRAFALATAILAAVSAGSGFIAKDLVEERSAHPECGGGGQALVDAATRAAAPK